MVSTAKCRAHLPRHRGVDKCAVGVVPSRSTRKGRVTMNFYRWTRQEYVSSGPGEFYSHWEPTPRAAGGESAHLSDLESCEATDADYLEIPYTTWGDYVGGTVDRSNYRVLLEDFRNLVVDVSGDFYSHSLVCALADWSADTDEAAALREIVRRLEDYPLVNEEDHSLLELEIAAEDWGTWLASDVGTMLEERGIDADALDAADVERRFYRLTYEMPYGPEPEGADSMRYPFLAETVDAMAAHYAAGADCRCAQCDRDREDAGQARFEGCPR